jgi:hypothetical protein
MQHALDAASIPITLLLLSLLAWLLYDIITERSARLRFARLQALRNAWRRDLGCARNGPAMPTRGSPQRSGRRNSDRSRRT